MALLVGDVAEAAVVHCVLCVLDKALVCVCVTNRRSVGGIALAFSLV